MFRFFTRFPFPIRAGGPHTHQPPSGNSQKTAKSAIPHLAGHALQPMPGCFPHASDPHTGNIPIPPQSDHAPAETSGRLTQTRRQPVSSNSLRLRRRAARRRRQRMTSPRDAASTSQWRPALKPARRPAPAAQGVDPRGTGAGWTRQKSADAAPDRAGRTTDRAGQARRHAGAWVRSLHFPTLSRIS